MIKKLVLFIVWVPLNFSLLVFSLYFLVNNSTVKVLGVNTSEEANTKIIADHLTITPVPKITPQNISPQTDIRISVLKKFLQSYESPLADLSVFLVDTADRWSLDYTLIPAISMQESGGCKVIPDDSYNCWGFGIYGSKMTKFSSYEEAINTIAKKIKETYIENGLVNPTLLENIWAPQSTGQWSYAVNYFIGKMKDLEKNIPAS